MKKLKKVLRKKRKNVIVSIMLSFPKISKNFVTILFYIKLTKMI